MSTHRRKVSGRNKVIAGAVAAAVVGGGAILLTGTAQAAGIGAAYTKTSDWSTGYTAQYVVTNNSGAAKKDWKLEFDLPSGAKLSSLWNAESGVSGQHITVTSAKWDTDGLAMRRVRHRRLRRQRHRRPDRLSHRRHHLLHGRHRHPGADRPPHGDRDGLPSPTATGKPTATATPAPTPTATASPSQSTGTGTTTSAGLRPLRRHLPLPGLRPGRERHRHRREGLQPRLRHRRRRLHPKWGGVTDLASDAVAAQIGALRAKGGDVRVSFGGAAGSELATTCSSADALATAYAKVVDAYDLTKVDFDVEGGALPNTTANTNRAKAIAKLQAQHPDLDVSFTLPVMPEGLTQDGVNLLSNAKSNGVGIDTVNIMAMDYGPAYSGDMGTYAEQAATATQAQVKSVLGLSDSAAWKAVAVTPMIGVNDVTSEIFKVEDATQLVNFAKSKGLGWLSMWSATRDKQCSGGAKTYADATCSSIVQDEHAFSKAFAAYN